MPHEFTFNKRNLLLLETALGRLKYSVRPSQLIKWLENFNQSEVSTALAILRSFEYIDSGELLLRLDHLLKELFSITRESTITFIPFGKYGKSSTLITYPLTHLDRYKTRERRGILNFESDWSKVLDKNSDFIVFIDDFIGSGDTFLKEIRKVASQIEAHNLKEKIFLLSPVIMEDAKKNIEDEFPYVKILSEPRCKYLSSDKSPIAYTGLSKEIQRLILNYGARIPVNPFPNLYIPSGHKESESLISFYYRTPNNTFPIIWGDANWTPLYPRTSKAIMANAKSIKKDISYLLNTFFDLNLNLVDADTEIDDSEDKRTSENIHRLKNNFFLLSLLYLKYLSKFDNEDTNLFIGNFLGITREELRLIYVEGKNKGYIDRSYNLTAKAYDLINRMLTKRKKNSIRKISEPNFVIDNYLFLPKTFRGSS